jgi:hypothetical protein
MTMILSIGSFYPSPRTGQYNSQVTESNLEGHLWLISVKNETTPVMEILGLYARYLDYDLGPVDARSRPDYHFYTNDSTPPRHFGYENHVWLGQAIDDNRYLAFGTAAIQFYESVFPTQGSFNAGDFERLGEDMSVSCILSNGDITIYWIVPMTA